MQREELHGGVQVENKKSIKYYLKCHCGKELDIGAENFPGVNEFLDYAHKIGWTVWNGSKCPECSKEMASAKSA